MRFPRVSRALLVLLWHGTPPLAQPQDAPIIESIELVVDDVFEDGGITPDFAGYRLANGLHVKTRESIVRQELLFAEGDRVDAEALAQTERNLRALPFLRMASVEIVPLDEGRVHVRVATADSWTTWPEFRFEKVGNEWVWSAGASERNLLGRGKLLRVSRDSGLDRDETLMLYRDPRLLGSRISTGIVLSDASDGHRAQFGAVRPFYAIDTAWGFRAALEDFDRVDPLFEEGERVEELRHERQLGELEVARAVRRAPSSAIRLHLGYRYSRDEIDNGTDLRQFGTVRLGLTAVSHDFLKLTHINRFERPEDINLGLRSSAFVGISTRALGGELGTSTFFVVGHGQGLRLGARSFLLANVSWQARQRNDRLENHFARFRVDAVHKFSLRKLLLAKADFRYGDNLDPEIQLRRGAESGLRGYPVRQFNGDRSFLMSVEGRWFFADDVARLVSLGVAAFADSGFAWPTGQPIAFRDLRSNIGAGLLLGSNRLSSDRPGIRIDVAYALEPVDGRSAWLVSAGSSIGF